MAAGGQEREAVSTARSRSRRRAAEQRAVAQVEAELAAVRADEVEHGADGLVRRHAQAAAELLQEQGGALGRSEHEDDVDRRDVDALVEQVDREDDLDAARGEVAQRTAA